MAIILTSAAFNILTISKMS